MPSKDTQDQELPAKRLRLAGEFVRQGLEDAGLKPIEASRQWGIARSQLYEVMKGDNDSPILFAQIEKRLGMPERFYRMVIEGNTRAIVAMDDLSQQWRVYALDRLAALEEPAKPKKQTGTN